MEITAKMVADLRQMTGVGMMECKKALTEANGNVDEAIKIALKTLHEYLNQGIEITLVLYNWETYKDAIKIHSKLFD